MEKTEEVETKEKAKSGDSAVMDEQKGKGPKKFKGIYFPLLFIELSGQWRDRGLLDRFVLAWLKTVSAFGHPQ